MGFERTSKKYYPELHKLYRDNIDLLRPIHKVGDTIFTHAGISNGWINAVNQLFKDEGRDFQLTEKNIVSFIGSEWTLELQNDTATIHTFYYDSLKSPIFCIGRSRGGDAPYGGPLWSDFYDDYSKPEDWKTYQIFSHQQREITGSIGFNDGAACVDSRAIFEYDLDTHFLKPSEINDETTKAKIPEYAWEGGQIRFRENSEESK